MPKLKWQDDYEIIRAALKKADNARQPDQESVRFDLTGLQSKAAANKIPSALIRNFLLSWFWVGRSTGWFVPLPKYWQTRCITRADDVEDVLSRSDIFNVPYGLEMAQLVTETNCLLGDDGPLHARQRTLLLRAFRPQDLKLIGSLCRRRAAELIENSDGTLNIFAGLITRVVTETCACYFGFKIDDADAFAQWTIAMSNWLFADPDGDEDIRRLALNGAARVRTVIDEAIIRGRTSGHDDTLVKRLIGLGATNAEIRAMLLAMTVGQVPTITLAAGNLFEELRRRPGRWDQAAAAARNGDMARLTTILVECARLCPALNPGLWRYVRQDTTIGTGWRRRRFREGEVILVCLLSALRDGYFFDHPNDFRLDRDPRGEPSDLMFGFDWHRCLGKQFALVEITEIFAALLMQDDLYPAKGDAGKMVKAGPYPRSLVMTFIPNPYRRV